MVAESEFLKFVAGIFEAPVESLTLHTAYQSIPQWDSVMHLRLVMEIEAAYGVSFSLETIPELKTLNDFYQVITRKTANHE